MTPRQKNAINAAREHIKEIRVLLDGVMYYTDPLNDSEFKSIREAYDYVCQAADKL